MNVRGNQSKGEDLRSSGESFIFRYIGYIVHFETKYKYFVVGSLFISVSIIHSQHPIVYNFTLNDNIVTDLIP